MNLNLILALFWGLLCVGMFVYPAINPRAGRLTLGETGLPFAWVAALVLLLQPGALVDVSHCATRDREEMGRRSGNVRPHPEERNPEFDFSDKGEESGGK